MVKAVRFHLLPHHQRTLHFEDVELTQPGDDEVEVRHTAILATNLDLDIGEQWASVEFPDLPFIPGFSAAGVITELGSGVLDYHVGQRVVYSSFPITGHVREHVHRKFSPPPVGCYSETRVVPTDCLVPLPDYIGDNIAAASLFPGLVARMLVKKLVSLKKEQKLIVHPATGDLGTLVCQWSKCLGAFVIGTAESKDIKGKAEISGCNTLVVCDDGTDLERKVRELTGEQDLSIVYDLLVKRKFKGYLGGLAALGLCVSVATEVDTDTVQNVSCPILRPDIGDSVTSRPELLEGATELFDMLKSGQLRISVIKQYPLELAAQAQERLAVADTLDCCILIPPIPDPRKIPDAS